MLLSVVIPIAQHDSLSDALFHGLRTLPENSEILLCVNESLDTPAWLDHIKRKLGSERISMPISEPENGLNTQNVRVIHAKNGRAHHMNAGASSALGDYVWFLHADSLFSPDTVHSLMRSISQHPNALLYFDLKFLPDAPRLMRVNEVGVWFRSHVLGAPFGDQGFCIKRDLFHACGKYDHNLAYGEDHVFVWQCRRHGVQLQHASSLLYTSARKYHTYGWGTTTRLHLRLWLSQAWQQWLITISSKRRQRT